MSSVRRLHEPITKRFNPLLIGEAAPPILQGALVILACFCFNPLLIGEAAPPSVKDYWNEPRMH